jgi:hypothetical protein
MSQMTDTELLDALERMQGPMLQGERFSPADRELLQGLIEIPSHRKDYEEAINEFFQN